jgi:hypothetical protein
MGSKKYKGKLCVYCSRRESTTGDHVFAREFFLPSQRNNLPQVPSCGQCNNGKSRIEHYLTTLLPFGGRHPDARENLATLVPGRLAHNTPLRRHLMETRVDAWLSDGGIYQHTMGVRIDASALEQLFALIVRGLVWYHWKVHFTDEHAIKVTVLSQAGTRLFEQQFCGMTVAQRIAANLGNGTVCYEGMQGVDCQQLTVWRMDVYGGLMLCGDPQAPDAIGGQIGVVTGPRGVLC